MIPKTELLDSISFANGLVDLVAEYLGIDHTLSVELQRMSTRCWISISHDDSSSMNASMIDERIKLRSVKNLLSEVFVTALMRKARGDPNDCDGFYDPSEMARKRAAFLRLLDCEDGPGPKKYRYRPV